MIASSKVRRVPFLCLLGALGAACADGVDKAAKARIFSPEAPSAAVSSAAEDISVRDLASSGESLRRVLSMSAAEATERLGPHRFRAQIKFEWPEPADVALQETRTLMAGQGGVMGDFHATTENSRDQGREVLRVAGRMFAKSRYGTFRERRRDRGMGERAREETYGALRDFAELFDYRMALTPEGTSRLGNRAVQRFSVQLSTVADAPGAVGLPALVTPRRGVDASTKRRLTFFERKAPKRLSGQIWVDGERAVVLKASLTGTLSVPADGGAKAAELHASLDAETTAVGVEPKLTVPEKFLPDEDKPPGIAEALERFGVRRKAATDGGVTASADPADEEP
ncbi:MAG: hypothetical protein ACKVPX_15740 [Myxococcaceae bacterium]